MQPEHLILTIGRQIGSGGLSVARDLSERLGIEMYDKQLLTEAAAASGLSTEVFERRDEKPRRLHLRSIFTGRPFSTSSSDMLTRGGLNDEALFKVQSDVMRTLAGKAPCIFVGRCADYVLRDFPRLFSVFITCGFDERVARVASERGIGEGAAADLIRQAEKARAGYYNYFTFKKWGDSASYDLCINSSSAGGSAATADIIHFTLKQKNYI